MKKFSRQQFNETVLGYYGCRKKKPVASQQSVILTKHYDDGLSEGLSLRSANTREYEVPFSKNGWLTEYEVMPAPAESSYQQNFSDPFFVESFEEYTANDADNREQGTFSQAGGPDNRPDPEAIVADAKEQAEKLKSDAVANLKIPEAPGDNLAKSKQSVTDDDFLADIKSILGGDKLYDTTAKKIIDKNKGLSGQSTQAAAPGKQDAIPPLETKNEHQIFEKIAQNMRYANAYNLGSFAIEQRFDDFDQFDEIKEKAKEHKSTPAPVPATLSKEAAPPVTAEDFLKDMDMISEAKAKDTAAKPSGGNSKEIPLDPGVGGRSIMVSAMQPGDIIISTTNADISKKIRQATGSQVSHASVYIGNGNVIEAIEDGVMQFSVETSIADDSVAVAYRHKDMSPEKAALVVNFLKQMKDQKRKFDYFSLLRVAPYQIVSGYCDSLASPLKEACHTAAGLFKTGTDSNNEFYCSELVFAALKQAGLSLSTVDPHWSSPQDVVRLNHNDTLRYVGHLKA